MSPIDKLTRTVERGFAAVADDLNEMRKTTATKADMNTGFLRIEERLASIEQELKDIKRRLTALEDKADGMSERYKQEIEDLWKHVAAIEKRLKIQRS